MPQAGLTARPAAVLFDLDGTLLDSAPDLAGTLNDMRADRGLPPLPFADLRAHAGSGARGMLGAGLHLRPGDADYRRHRDEFHDRYEARMLHSTRLFETVDALLGQLAARGLRWGIVTNKSLRFAAPLVRAHAPLAATMTLIGGDSTPHTKPHPAPLLAAAEALGVEPSRCVYVGDDHRDMLAARAAGMGSWAAAWGYLGPGASVDAWGADRVLADPLAVLQSLELA